MGLFRKLFGLDDLPAPNPKERVDGIEPPIEEHCAEQEIELVISMSEPSDSDWEAKREEQIRLQNEGKAMRRIAIMGQGVNIDQFTDAKTLDDALVALDTFVPKWSDLNVSSDLAIISGDFQNLTKTGKVPKNVYIGRVFMEEQAYYVDAIDSVSVEIKYMADGSINMANVGLNHNAKHLSFALRNKDGSWEITSIDTYDIRRDFRQRIYNGDSRDAQELLISAWDVIWK